MALKDSIFTVKPEHLAGLGPDRAVDLFRELLWVEASRIGLSRHLVNVPSWITVGDGGVDAEVETELATGERGLIRPGLTRYQIKSGKFSLAKTKLRELLCKQNSEELNTRVKSCLDNGGTFVAVLFGYDKPDKTDDECKKRFAEVLEEIEPRRYKDPKIEILLQNGIRGLLAQHLALALKVAGKDKSEFLSHGQWQSQSDMTLHFVEGSEQSRTISAIREELRNTSHTSHLNVFGEPGIGKTRLALEATGADDLSPLVVYCDGPGRLLGSELMNELMQQDSPFHAILVVDECRFEDRAVIWNQLSRCASYVKLLTISCEEEKTSGRTVLLETPRLVDDDISMIFQAYGIEKMDSRLWVSFCVGSPRAAHILALNLMNNPHDLLRTPDDVDVWGRWVVGSHDKKSDYAINTLAVLKHLALFKRIGVRQEELGAIVSLIGRLYPSITGGVFDDIVRELKKRKILQGESILYITPKLLHIYLFAEWFRTHGDRYDFHKFTEGLPASLVGWHQEMFEYASADPLARKIAGDLLARSDLFGTGDDLNTDAGSSFFLALTNSDPESALRCLERTIGCRSKSELVRFRTGRQNIVWALERIAMWGHLFQRTACILLALAEAENEKYSNNATGIFCDLYSPGVGSMAPTQLPPIGRLPILVEAFKSSSQDRKLIAIEACNRALETGTLTRQVGSEYQGLKQVPDMWIPRTWGEQFDYYRQAWDLLFSSLDNLEADQRETVCRVLIERSIGLSIIRSLADHIIDNISVVISRPEADKALLIERIGWLIEFRSEVLTPETLQRWKDLRDKQAGSDFHSKLNRYVGMLVRQDDFQGDDEESEAFRSALSELAKEALADPPRLETQLRWLVTDAARRGLEFGLTLGNTDEKLSMLGPILEAQKTHGSDTSFVGGYFRAIFNRDIEQWEEQLESMVADSDLCQWVPEITLLSGLTDRAALRLLDLARKGVMTGGEFIHFSYGKRTQHISDDVINHWLEFLLDSGDTASLSSALSLHSYHYLHGRPDPMFPEGLTYRMICHRTFLGGISRPELSNLAAYEWGLAVKMYCLQHPEKSLTIAQHILEHFEDDRAIFRGDPVREDVLNPIAQKYPEEVWTFVTQYLSPRDEWRALGIADWLREKGLVEKAPGALEFFSLEGIWAWVDEDPQERAPHLARFVPPWLFHEEGRTCYAREVLARYGSMDSVRLEFHCNYGTEGHLGPASVHYQNKKEHLLNFKAKEENANVLKWVDEELAGLDKEIRDAREREERRGF